MECGEPQRSARFPGGHFHTGEELAAFSHVEESVHQAALTLVRKVGHLPGIRDITNHLIGIGRVSPTSADDGQATKTTVDPVSP